MTTSSYLSAALAGVVLTLVGACAGGGDREPASESPSPSHSATAETDGTPTSSGSTTAVQVTQCDDVRLPAGGVGEADFDVDPVDMLLGIHFSDTRNGKYRNISYTVRYFDDPTCRTTPRMAELIGRVDPSGWPPLVLGPAGVGPLRLGMTYTEVANTGTATAPLGSHHDGWSPGCRILMYRTRQLGHTPGDTLNGTVSPQQGLEEMYATRRMVTPQGIRIGSTINDVQVAYDRHDAGAGDFIVVRASDRAVYRIQLGGVVTSISLGVRRLDCTR